MFDKLLGAAAIAAAALLLPAIAGGSLKDLGKPKGSPNNAGTQERVVSQVIGLLSESGIPARRSEDDGPQISLGTASSKVARGAHQAAERVLLSTGYRPKTMKVGGEYKIAVQQGPPKAPSADPAIRL